MIKIRALVSTIIVSAVVAGPILAQDAFAESRSRDRMQIQAHHHGRVYHRNNFHGAYNSYRQPNIDEMQYQRNRENFGFSGRDRSRVGGEDPALHPLPN